jgi:hypothetical protein
MFAVAALRISISIIVFEDVVRELPIAVIAEITAERGRSIGMWRMKITRGCSHAPAVSDVETRKGIRSISRFCRQWQSRRRGHRATV